MFNTITVTKKGDVLLEDLEIYPCGDIQLEINGWESSDLSEIEPGAYEVYGHIPSDEEPTYEIWYCDEEGEAGWRYLYYMS